MGPLRVAGLWRRCLALAADLVVVHLGLAVARGVVAAMALPPLVALALDATVILVGPAAYFALMVGTGGQTVGKWLLAVRVVTRGGESVGYDRALGRALAFLPSMVSGIGVLPALVRPDRRALHDLIAGTWVVRATRRA